jgi:acid phosphatase (class A)
MLLPMKSKAVAAFLEGRILDSEMMKNSIRRARLLLIAASYGVLALEQLPADPASAPATSPSAPQHASLSWLSESAKTYVLEAVPPPPAFGSDKDKADLQAVLKAQAMRTPDEIKEAVADQKFTIGLLAGVISPDFTPENYPVTFDFLNRVREDESFLTSTLKKRYKRHRPYQDHPEVKNLFTVEQASYPSGHAAGSRMLVLVLAELFHDKSAALLNRDNLVSQSRVNAGVHYPSDIIAGRALAHALIFVLQGNAAFERDMANAQAEIAIKKKSTTDRGAK